MQFFETLGWVGNILLSIGIIPQVIKTWRTHNVDSFSWLFLLNIETGKFQWSLWLNYLVNILGTTYLVYAKARYSKPGNV